MNETTNESESNPWKIGDWCFYEFELAMVKEVDVMGVKLFRS